MRARQGGFGKDRAVPSILRGLLRSRLSLGFPGSDWKIGKRPQGRALLGNEGVDNVIRTEGGVLPLDPGHGIESV